MEQIKALARPKYLFAAVAIVLGIIVSWPLLMSKGAQEPLPEAIELQDGDLLELDASTLDNEPAASQQPDARTTPIAEYVIVYISGAVLHPDVYQLPPDARVKDVVLAAGGLTEDAAAEQINLAERIADAQHIHIPSQNEAAAAPAAEPAGASTASEDALLNINTASAADIEDLPGIGPAFAQRIVEYRTANGPFQSVEDLQKVKGIGPALFEDIAPLITAGL
jgi:competence protein ComEA